MGNDVFDVDKIKSVEVSNEISYLSFYELNLKKFFRILFSRLGSFKVVLYVTKECDRKDISCNCSHLRVTIL